MQLQNAMACSNASRKLLVVEKLLQVARPVDAWIVALLHYLAIMMESVERIGVISLLD